MFPSGFKNYLCAPKDGSDKRKTELNGELMNDEQKAYVTIFGYGKVKGDAQKLSSILNDFCQNNPGQKAGLKTGVSRGSISLTKFVKSEGSIFRKKTQRAQLRWDRCKLNLLHFYRQSIIILM